MKIVQEMKMICNYSDDKWIAMRNKLRECLTKNAGAEGINSQNVVSIYYFYFIA